MDKKIDCLSDSDAVGSARLLGIAEVSQMTGFCPVVASRLIDESGCAIVVHRRKFIFADRLEQHLRSMEGVQDA